MSKFSTIALTIASAATIVVIGVAASATASSLPMITGSSSSSTESSTPPAETTAPASEEPASDAITADIFLSLGATDEVGATTFEVTGVPVGDGPELTRDDRTENPRESGCSPTVDVSLNPTTITVTGAESGCFFPDAYVEVTLHGIEFSSTTVLSDNLFEQGGSEEFALNLDGGSYKAKGIRRGASDPFPVLDSFGASGSTFAAYWSGASSSSMNGAAVFRWVPVARAGGGVAAAPAFTG